VNAAVWVRGTDPLGGQIPLMFVHQQGDSTAWLQIAKLGDDAELVVRRTAWTWGLTFPSVIVPAVFRGRTTDDSSTVELSSSVTPATLRLQAGDHSSTLRLTPLLGWSLVQPVFTVQSPLRGLAQLSWVCLLISAVAWWASRATRPRALTAVLGFTVGAWLALLPRAFDLAPLSTSDWSAVFGALASGAIVASALPRHRRTVN
jgi:hypothetical protein